MLWQLYSAKIYAFAYVAGFDRNDDGSLKIIANKVDFVTTALTVIEFCSFFGRLMSLAHQLNMLS